MSKGDRPEFGKGEAMTLSNQSNRSIFDDDEALYQSIKALIEQSRTQYSAGKSDFGADLLAGW
jgi:hypothetical protein